MLQCTVYLFCLSTLWVSVMNISSNWHTLKKHWERFVDWWRKQLMEISYSINWSWARHKNGIICRQVSIKASPGFGWDHFTKPWNSLRTIWILVIKYASMYCIFVLPVNPLSLSNERVFKVAYLKKHWRKFVECWRKQLMEML